MNSARPVRPSNKIKRYSQQEIFSNTFNRQMTENQKLKIKKITLIQKTIQKISQMIFLIMKKI